MDIRKRDKSTNAMRALLKSDKLSAVLKKGIDAPPGSTARKHAQQILSVVKRGAIDGAGGPGIPMRQRNQPIGQNIPHSYGRVRNPRQQYGNMRIFPATPKPRIPIGKRKAAEENLANGGIIQEAIRQGLTTPQAQPPQTPMPQAPGGVMDGKGGPGDYSFLPGTTTTLDPVTVPEPTTKWQNFKTNVSSLVSSIGKIFSPGPDTPEVDSSTGIYGRQTGTGAGTAPYDSYLSNLDIPISGRFNIGSKVDTTIPMQYDPNSQFFKTLNQYKPGEKPPSLQFPNLTGDGSSKLTVSATGSQPDAGGTPDAGAGTPGSGSAGSGSAGAGAGTGTPTDPAAALQSQYPRVSAAIASGIGPTSFALNAMNDPEYLRKLYPGMPESFYTGGGDLQSRLNAVQEATKKEFDLDNKLGQLNSLVTQGFGLGERLTDYIRGRDEFLNETNRMLEDFQERAVNMDLSSPIARKAASDYTNYLYTLRGRQNKRYIEFLNSSVSTYEARLSTSENVYNNAVARYEEELQKNQAMTENQFNTLFAGLSELYTSVQNEPKRLLELEQLKTQIYATGLGAVKDAIDENDLSSHWDDEYQETTKKLKAEGILDSDGRLIRDISVSDFTRLDEWGITNPVNALEAIIWGAEGAMNPNDKGEYNVEEIHNRASSMLNLINQLESSGQLTNKIDAYNYRQRIVNAMTKNLKRSGAYTGQEGTIREAIQWLADVDTARWRPFNKGDVGPTKEEFMKEWGNSTIAPELLETIYADFDDEGYKTNREDFVLYYLNKPVVQNGQEVWVPRTDDELLSVVLDQYGGRIANIQTYVTGQSESDQLFDIMFKKPVGINVRATQNNNPLNIKSRGQAQGEAAVNDYRGVVGTDPTPAKDGGYFLKFDSWESGLMAAFDLIQSTLYTSNIGEGELAQWNDKDKEFGSPRSVDSAVRMWSNNGYTVNDLVPRFAGRDMADLSPIELKELVFEMYRREIGLSDEDIERLA